jgi:hypothetical protein
MNYYFLPGSGTFGGIKVGYQLAGLLWDLGIPVAVASPNGEAAQWFQSSVPVLDENEALRRLRPADCVLFSLPQDYQRLRATGNRLLFHCQGTDPRIDPILADPESLLLTCWRHATEYVRHKSGREPVEVGVALADNFFATAADKRDNLVAFMPRRGRCIVSACQARCRKLRFRAIDGMDELQVGTSMRECGYFLATSEGEWFGLPALEAMAAGCVVLSVPVIGGHEYLRSGENCILAGPEDLPLQLSWISQRERAPLRAALRQRALATAFTYRLSTQKKRLRQLLQRGLEVLCS